MECGNRLRVGVRAKNAVACRGLRVGPSKGTPKEPLQQGLAERWEKLNLDEKMVFWLKFG